MRYTILLPLILLFACNHHEPIKTEANIDTLKTVPETLQATKHEPETSLPKTYFNERFKDVTVERTGQDILSTWKGPGFRSRF